MPHKRHAEAGEGGHLWEHIFSPPKLNLGPRDEERRAHEHAGEQFKRSQAGQTRANWQGGERDRANETKTATSRTLNRSRLGPRTNVLERLGPQSNVGARLGPQGARVRERSRRQAVEGSSQTQPSLLPHGQGNQGDRPLGAGEEVSQSYSRHRRCRSEIPSLRAEDDDRRPLARSRATKGIDPWELEKKFANHARGTEDVDLNDLPCEQRMTIDAHQLARGPTRGNKLWKDPPKLNLLSCPQRMMIDAHQPARGPTRGNKLQRNPHKLNLLIYPTGRAPEGIDPWEPRKKLAGRARGTKDVGPKLQPCGQRMSRSYFQEGLANRAQLYWELAITPSQTLAEVFATAERYALWDDDRIAAKKASKQVDHLTKQASQKSNKFKQKARDKGRSRPQEGNSETGTFTEFAIPIHQILAQVKDKPWVRRPPPMKGDPSIRDTNCAFHGEHGHYTNNCNAWKRHLEELVREGHSTEFVAKKAIQQIEDRDAAAKEPPQKVIRINTILADSQESG
ncbi:unnamed protein product [Prunus armeniaca]